MDTVGLMIDVLGPVVLIVALGAVIGPRIEVNVATLSKVAYWVFGPAFIFEVFATTTLEAGTAARLVGAAVAAMAVSAVLTALLGHLFGLGRAAADVSIMSATYANAGNAGLAICAFALGEDAIDRAGILMVTIVFGGTLVAVWLGTRQTKSSVSAALTAIRSPMSVAALIGLAMNLSGTGIPLAIERAVSTVAEGLIPTMLFGLGVQLAMIGNIRWTRSTSLVAVVKLVVAPLAAWLVARSLGLSGDDMGVVVLQSAMPPAVFCMVIALEHDLEPELATNNVAAVTLAGLLTLPFILVLVV